MPQNYSYILQFPPSPSNVNEFTWRVQLHFENTRISIWKKGYLKSENTQATQYPQVKIKVTRLVYKNKSKDL